MTVKELIDELSKLNPNYEVSIKVDNWFDNWVYDPIECSLEKDHITVVNHGNSDPDNIYLNEVVFRIKN